MSRAWLYRNGRFWRFWGCRQEEGNCIWRAWLWGWCRQPNAARLHPVSLVGPEMRTKRILRPQGFRRTLYTLINSRITSQGWHNLALTQL
jgi:hypothetical protein